MSYNPEYYSTPETQGKARDLLEGELSVVDNIKNEQANKDALIKANEDIYPVMEVTPTRELYSEEINVVENIKNYESNKSSIPTRDDEEVQMEELMQKVRELEEAISHLS